MKIYYDIYETDPEENPSAEFVKSSSITITPDMVRTMFNIYFPNEDIGENSVDWGSLYISKD